jgi:Replication protein
MPRHPQLDILEPEQIWQASLLAKVRGLIDYSVWDNLDRCGKEEVYITCAGCGSWKTHYYQCCLKFCPVCNWRIARERSAMLKEWSFAIKQPKHVVLTQKNFDVLNKQRVTFFRQAFAKLRRTKLWREVLGGCISIEITNEGNGWHLHAHVLADVRWLDAGALAVEWGRLVGQEFGIVKVMDARGMSYLGEVTKYVCKPAQMVAWPPAHIAQFINTVRGIRFFATYGSLFDMQKEIRLRLRALKPKKQPCICGCTEVVVENERASILGELRIAEKRRSKGR